MYGYVDLVNFILNLINNLDDDYDDEPCSYKAILCFLKKPSEWMFAMNKKIEFLYKN
jgi:hypothetical protein